MSEKVVVVITGTSSGFGYETARLAALAGHQVFGTMRDLSGRSAAAATRLTEMGVTPIEMDVTDEASSIRGTQAILAAAGHVDVLVNNAGTAHFGATEAFTTQSLERQFATNVFGAFRVTRAFLPGMRSRRKGLVVFVSSIAGRLILPFTGVYTSSKWAVEGLAESLSYEVRPFGVDVAIVEPGAYSTNIGNTTVTPDDHERLASYGDVAKLLDNVGAGLAKRIRSNPAEVGQAITALIAMPAGQRPLRTAVPSDALVEAINEATEPLQRAALESFGVSTLAAPRPEATPV